MNQRFFCFGFDLDLFSGYAARLRGSRLTDGNWRICTHFEHVLFAYLRKTMGTLVITNWMKNLGFE
jgi:hypothetical protein